MSRRRDNFALYFELLVSPGFLTLLLISYTARLPKASRMKIFKLQRKRRCMSCVWCVSFLHPLPYIYRREPQPRRASSVAIPLEIDV